MQKVLGCESGLGPPGDSELANQGRKTAAGLNTEVIVGGPGGKAWGAAQEEEPFGEGV